MRSIGESLFLFRLPFIHRAVVGEQRRGERAPLTDYQLGDSFFFYETFAYVESYR